MYVSSCYLHVCVGIPDRDGTPTTASLLCKQAHQTSPLLCLTSIKAHQVLVTYLFVTPQSPIFSQRCPLIKSPKGKKNGEVLLGPADLQLDFNWVVKSNPELFQECQNVIPWLVYRRSPAVKDTDR